MDSERGRIMDFDLAPEYEKLIATVREFGEQHFTCEAVRQWQHDAGLPDEVVRDFVNLDFNGFGVIHRRDHVTYDTMAQTLVLEELARVSGAALPFPNDFLNLQIMEEFAGSGQFEFVRTGYQTEGRLAFALAISEPEGGSDTMSMRTSARTIDGRLVLNGTKTFVNNGEYAPYLLVAAIDRDASTGKHPALSFWLVPHDLPGIKVYPVQKIGQSILPFSTVVFENVRLDEPYRLHGKQAGFPQLFHLFEIGRLFSCATALGLAQAAMEDAVAYARTRTAFGTQIANFQQIEQMLTDMEVKLDNMRNSVYKNAWKLDRGCGDRLGVALMKRDADIRRSRVHAKRARLVHMAGLPRLPDGRGDRPDHGVRRGTAHHGEVRVGRVREVVLGPCVAKPKKSPADHKTRSRRGSFSFGRLSTRSALMQSTNVYPYRSNCWSHFRNQGLIL